MIDNCEQLISRICSLSFPNTFNPYRDRCDVYDYAYAPAARRKLLRELLQAASASGTHSIWIGRDLGYRGGRRTGLALTDDVHACSHLQRWGVRMPERQIVKGAAQSERTASVIWRMLSEIRSEVFLWNVFPLHPHESGNPFSNRAHSSKERAAGEDVLALLIDLLNPRIVVALGRDACESAKRCAGSREIVPIRHPSYGGVRDFETGLRATYGLPPSASGTTSDLLASEAN